MTVDIYIEHTVKGPKRQKGVLGYLISYTDSKGREATKAVFETEDAVTPHEMDLLSIYRALENLNRPCEVHIISSGKYVENMLKAGYLKKWSENGWLTAKGELIKNQNLWKILKEQLDKHDVIWQDGGSAKEWLMHEVEVRKNKED